MINSRKIRFCIAALAAIFAAPQIFSQSSPKVTTQEIPTDVFSVIGIPGSQQTPIQTKQAPLGLPVKVIYEWPNLVGPFQLTITLSQRNSGPNERSDKILSESTLFLENLGAETDAIITYPKGLTGLQIEANLRDENQNLVLGSSYPLPVLNQDMRILKLTPPTRLSFSQTAGSEFGGLDTISGKVILPTDTSLAAGSTLHVRLLENALAGGPSIQILAQATLPAISHNGSIPFTLQHSIRNTENTPDSAFLAWITDITGQRTFVMPSPVNYNGPDVRYRLRLDSLKQGAATKRGQDLNLQSLSQSLVIGEAEYIPVNGIPRDARLKVTLKQDRGDFNQNPTLTEQTLIIPEGATRVPFSLVTNSLYFDPYAPAPILTATLTDRYGQVYYDSGKIRAQEGQNYLRLFPR